MDMGWILTFLPYGPAWRQQRRMVHSVTHQSAAKVYQPSQLRGARRFIHDVLLADMARPTDRLSEAAKAVLPAMIRRSFAMTAVDYTYGIDVRGPEMESRFVDVPEGVLDAANIGATPGKFWVDFLPFREFPSQI